MYDPFYRDETARRTFFDRYAFTAEVSFRPVSPLQTEGLATGLDPFGLSLRFDYQLAQRFDLSVLMDAAGSASGRKLSVNWVALKYYRTVETRDYAFRLAVDPSFDGRSGFPQMDLAFLYTSFMTPTLSTDFGIGVRRVRIGYQQIINTPPPVIDPDDPIITPPPSTREVIRTRAIGWEMHLMMNYNLLFDLAGSNLFVTLLGEGGTYDLVEWSPEDSNTPNPGNLNEEDARSTLTFRGGVLWARTGLDWERPNYQLAPFLGVPLLQWAPNDGEWPTARLRVGVRFMLR